MSEQIGRAQVDRVVETVRERFGPVPRAEEESEGWWRVWWQRKEWETCVFFYAQKQGLGDWFGRLLIVGIGGRDGHPDVSPKNARHFWFDPYEPSEADDLGPTIEYVLHLIERHENRLAN